jgi:hypothetical protein
MLLRFEFDLAARVGLGGLFFIKPRIIGARNFGGARSYIG